MGAFNNYIASIKASLTGSIPLGGTLIGTSEDVTVAIAQQIKGGWFVLPTLDALVDLPYNLLEVDMEVTVKQYTLSGGTIHPRTRYVLRNLPPVNTKINQVPGYVLDDYFVKLDEKNFDGSIENQYAPNFNGKRPFFLSSEITPEAYQAGYPNNATYIGGNPADKIWVNTYDPLLNHAWVRQRIQGSSTWGIPVAINSGSDYEDNQYIDTIFKWVTKGGPAPARPVQGTDYTVLPSGWLDTPGTDYATRILTEDLYRSQALRNPYGVLKSNWDTPILVSSDPQLVRYGNTPGNTDYFNETYWRGYYTPGLDTHQATRPNGASNDWTILKIDQESGEFPDFVFKNFPIGVSPSELIAAIPTSPYPVGGVFPNDCFDTPPEEEENKVLYQSTSTKYSDGSLKVPWSLWRRFDGLNSIVATLEASPGDTFYKVRNTSGNLEYVFPAITLEAKLYNGNAEVSTGFNGFKWYRGGLLIVFDSVTRKATNLGISYNAYHTISVDGKSLEINPEGIDASQDYTVGINHVTRPSQDYETSYQLKDATDDGSVFLADIFSVQGTTFKNGSGLLRFDAKFFKGGIDDAMNVVFSWTIKNAAGVIIANGLKNSSGVAVGYSNYVAPTVYVSGADIDQFATLELQATFGSVVRNDRITLTDVSDAEALEHLYWGSGTTDPGSPTDFLPRTLTKQQVLDLNIGYSEDGTGKWYLIQRVGGVWGGEIQIRAEAARPNAGLFLQVYKNVTFATDGAPAAPAVPTSGSIIPSGWTQVPTAFSGSEDRTYFTVCFFQLRTDVAANPTVLTRDNYNPIGTFGTPKLVGVSAPPPASPGADGNDGWSPILAAEVRGDGKTVLKVVDWTGGEGTKPAANTTTSYITPTGLGTIDNAASITGPPGADANVRPQYTLIKGGIKEATPDTSLTSTEIALPLTYSRVTNNWSEARAFLLLGEVKFAGRNNGSGNDIDVVNAFLKGVDGDLGSYSPGQAPPLTSFTTIYDQARVDVSTFLSNQNINSYTGMKGILTRIVIISPGETKSFILSARLEATVNAWVNQGNLIAIGL